MLLPLLLAAACASDSGSCGSDACADMIEIPFRGNVYVTSCSGELFDVARNTISTEKGVVTDWDDRNTGLSFFFRTDSAGELNLKVEAYCPEGTAKSKLAFSYGGKRSTIVVDSAEPAVYDLGCFNVQAPGYVRIDIEGLNARPAAAQFARISRFFVGGAAAAGTLNCTTPEMVDDSYWYRRGPSVHFAYTLPEEDVEWFYNEATVPEGFAPPSTYYMLTGFREGYMGIQTHSDAPNSVLFSVWSPFTTDNPSEIPDDMKVLTLRRGEGVTAQDFGGEGSGGQSFMDYDWLPGKTYGTLVHVHPNGDNTTDFTGYFRDEKGQWHLLASFRRPQTDTWYKKAHSFLECFEPETSIVTRKVLFGNQWACLKDGTWVEITEAKFTCDNTGRTGMRADMLGTVEDGRFMLRNCGFFNEKTEYGTMFTRPSGGRAPEIDFAALEDLR